MIALLLDQGLPRGAIRELLAKGVAAQHVGELGMAASPDEEILNHAKSCGAAVVTLDADFHHLLALSGNDRPSVVRLRAEGLKAAEAALLICAVLDKVGPLLVEGVIVSANRRGVRVRRLPLTRRSG